MPLKPSGCCEAGSKAESVSCCEAGSTDTCVCCEAAGDGKSDVCSPSGPQKKHLFIDFLYLDLSVCERCRETDGNLDKALESVSSVLQAAGFGVSVNKVNIYSEALANMYEFASSPTIRINGKDITLEVRESNCKDCGDLCGDSVDCRVFVYEGVSYDSPPKEMIINAILKEVYGANPASANSSAPVKFILPENLRKFFEGHGRPEINI